MVIEREIQAADQSHKTKRKDNLTSIDLITRCPHSIFYYLLIVIRRYTEDEKKDKKVSEAKIKRYEVRKHIIENTGIKIQHI